MTTSPPRIAVFSPLIVAVGTTFSTILIHALAVIAIVHYFRRARRRGRFGAGFWQDLTIVAGTTQLALMAHLVEVAAWAIVFELCAQFPDFAGAFYHSAENYTTLGYGDVVMSASWRLLGPLEAADGMLMFGVSTAMIFAVVARLIQIRYPDAAS
jgi:hypothetical protein